MNLIENKIDTELENPSDLYIRHFTGEANNERIKKIYPIREAKDGEHILPFGVFKGYTLEHVNEFDHAYVVFLSTFDPKINNKKNHMRISLEAIKLVTAEERNDRLGKINYINGRLDQVRWLLTFISNHDKWSHNNRDKRFLNSIRTQLLRQLRIELLSKKQLTVIANIWARHFSKSDEGNRFDRERERFKEKMRPYWKRKYDRIEDI